ncbi:MAG TPA: LapA family protein [Thermoanaerobacterales bacterium]|nr:LapA family protein [Thermoanaerobacterales bacterium]
MQYTLVFGLIFALLVGLFAVSNSEIVTIRFPWGNYAVSQAIIILGSAAFGAITVTILGLIKQFKSKLKQWETDKKIKNLEGQIEKQENEIKQHIEEKEKITRELKDYKRTHIEKNKDKGIST